MRRKDFADIPLREAGNQAFTHYVSWYCSLHSALITAPSALDPHSLRAFFLVPTANDAVSSMAHSFHARKRSASASVMDMTLSSMREHPSMANDEEVAPAVLENAVSVMEALELWQQTKASRCELESGIQTSLESLSALDAKLRAIPPHAHAVRMTLMHAYVHVLQLLIARGTRLGCISSSHQWRCRHKPNNPLMHRTSIIWSKCGGTEW